MIWRCPNCSAQLQQNHAMQVCENGHGFDIARQGYINLLLPNQKNSRNPGDSEAMVQARRQFLHAGLYQPLVDKLHSLSAEHLQNKANPTIVDVGCGEGFYLQSICQRLLNHSGEHCSGYGLDISKPAIKKAALSAKQLVSSNSRINLQYAVASSFQMPVLDASTDLIINVFAPASAEDMARVLTADGLLIKVSPGARHLYQLKTLIYNEVREHTPPAVDVCFELRAQQELSFNIRLPSPEVTQSLLAMTPFAWHGDKEAKNKIIAHGLDAMEISFTLQVLARK